MWPTLFPPVDPATPQLGPFPCHVDMATRRYWGPHNQMKREVDAAVPQNASRHATN